MYRTTFREMVHQAFQGAIERAFPELPNQQAVVAPTGNPKIADYQCNNAMIISGRLPQPPKEKPAPAENGQVAKLCFSRLSYKLQAAGGDCSRGLLHTVLSTS